MTSDCTDQSKATNLHIARLLCDQLKMHPTLYLPTLTSNKHRKSRNKEQ